MYLELSMRRLAREFLGCDVFDENSKECEEGCGNDGT